MEVSFERNHHVAGVGRDDTLEEGDGARDSSFCKETENPNHGKAAIVDLRNESLLPLLVTHALVETKGIVEVERKDGTLFVGELPWLSTSHIVGLLVLGNVKLVLVPDLKSTDSENDLQ